MAVETLLEATERLSRAGFTHRFRAEKKGLRDLETDVVYSPEALVVEEVVRFEGVTDPDDEAALFALRSENGDARGTYSVAYGPKMDPCDIEAVRRLRLRRG